MRPHRPDMVTSADGVGRWHSTCLTCGESSRPSFHKPAVEDWRRAHIKAATAPAPERTP